MVHVQTGNRLDVVYDYEGDVKVLRGLKPFGSDELIPLPDPEGLIEVLQQIVKECAESANVAPF